MSREPAPKAFASAAAFRRWLAQHHDTEPALVVRCFKRHAHARGMTHPEAVDEALCFGWIDGVRRSVDADSFSVRFSPRKTRSIWSAINIRRMGELEAEGRVRAPGRTAFRAREERRSRVYSFEAKRQGFGPGQVKRFRKSPRAWAFFQAQAPWYRRTSEHWVMSAKREETRARRLDVLIASSERGVAIPPLAGKPMRGASQARRGATRR